MSVPKLVTGDDIVLPVTLKKNGVTFTIAPTAVVYAMLVNKTRTKKYTESIAQLNSATGADWANSLVVVELASVDTIEIPNSVNSELLEIQVNDDGRRTWFATVDIIKGNID